MGRILSKVLTLVLLLMVFIISTGDTAIVLASDPLTEDVTESTAMEENNPLPKVWEALVNVPHIKIYSTVVFRIWIYLSQPLLTHSPSVSTPPPDEPVDFSA